MTVPLIIFHAVFLFVGTFALLLPMQRLLNEQEEAINGPTVYEHWFTLRVFVWPYRYIAINFMLKPKHLSFVQRVTKRYQSHISSDSKYPII
jgi:hypothetical protein